ncbi:hypothetical protein SY88_04120 [Clostridiales bacterium PH28_bin88]|nr:hypothetical protein SY88_04120 [Clostridiales bacterium PH28_bin88]
MNSLLASISRWWGSLTGSQKSIYIVMAGAVIAAVFFFVQWMGRVNYAPLFTQLDPREASGVVEKLKELNVKYQLADQGGTVLVPEEKVYELRMQMVGSGMLVGGGVGFEIFDQSKLGMTDFERRMDYLRALQEELRRTIVQVEEVEQARVHLVLPEPSVFIQEDRPASASVTLKLSPLGRLNPEQVKAIVYLVASAVENLPPENVKVIDTRGNILSDTVAVGDNPAGLTQQRLAQQEMKRTFERDMERRIQGMLERILGQGKAVAMVSADLDFDQREITRIEYNDENRAVRTESVRDEQGSSTGGTLGPVGSDSNMVSYPAQGTQGQSNWSKTGNDRVYEVGQTQERIVYAPGRLKSLSTAVTVDSVLDVEAEKRIRDMVAAATGYQYSDDPSGRRDQITVMSMAFDNTQVAEAKKEMEALAEARRKEERLRRYVAWGLQGLATILGFILLMIIIRRIGSSRSTVSVTLDEPIPVTEYMPSLPPEEVHRREKQEKIKEMARQKPEEVAQLVKTWMAED